MKYKIGVCSLFRDSMVWNGFAINQVDRYFQQLYGQKGINLAETGFFLLEGDSRDNTMPRLLEYADRNRNIFLLQQNAEYGAVASTEDGARIRSLSKLGHTVIELARENCEYILFVESDLIIRDNLVSTLLQGIEDFPTCGMIAPIVLSHNTQTFYDTWAFCNIDETRWSASPPYSDALQKFGRYVPMNSIGSCALIRTEAVKAGANFYEGAFVEFSKKIREVGYSVCVDKECIIEHPSTHFVNGRMV